MSSRILDILAQKQWSQRRLARESGLDPVYVNRIINERKDIRLSTAHRLARALNCRIEELFPAEETREAVPTVNSSESPLRHNVSDALE
jgi:putative transcriptional regulator